MVRIGLHNRSLFLVSLFALCLCLFTNSAMAQITFGPPALLNTNGTTDTGADAEPFITTDNAGNWVAVWQSAENLGGTAGTDKDIFVSRSTDAGVTWTAPALLNTNGTTDAGSDASPSVETDGAGNWVAVWQSTENLGGTAGTDNDIFVSRSTDAGVTWTAPALLNTNGTTDTGEDIWSAIETDSAGNWVVVWGSTENLAGAGGAERDIFVSRSTDAGVTWTAPALLNSNATTDTGHDNFPRMATDNAGNWVVVWEGATPTDFDIFVSRSTDAGATWTAQAFLNTNGGTDTKNDSVPSIETDGVGNWVAVWHSLEDIVGSGTDWDVFVTRSTDAGMTWTSPALLNTNGKTDTGGDAVPTIETDGIGNWVAVWHSFENLGGTAGTDVDVFVATSTDNGATWTAPALLNTNGTSDTGNDLTPEVTTDGLGNWVVAWSSDENLGGTAGTDNDIFVATATLAPVGLPGSTGWMLGVSALAILGVGLVVLRRSTTY